MDRLNAQLAANQDELASLQQQYTLAEKRLARAGTLIDSLAGEAVRWQESSEAHDAAKGTLVGDAFIAAACVSYQGPFAGPHRAALLGAWLQACGTHGLAVAPGFTLRGFLDVDMEARQWQLQVRSLQSNLTSACCCLEWRSMLFACRFRTQQR